MKKTLQNKENTDENVHTTSAMKSELRKQSARRKRSDCLDSKIEIIKAATRKIAPPSYIRFKDIDYNFWDSIIAEFPKIEWTNHNLEVAALLARSMSDLEIEQVQLRKEGAVCKGKINPRKHLVEMHLKNVLALRRSLSLHSRGMHGETRDVAKRRAAAQKLESSIDDIEDDLITRPKSVQ